MPSIATVLGSMKIMPTGTELNRRIAVEMTHAEAFALVRVIGVGINALADITDANAASAVVSRILRLTNPDLFRRRSLMGCLVPFACPGPPCRMLQCPYVDRAWHPDADNGNA